MSTKKILFIQTAFIGDVILTLPALQKLKEMNSEYLIDVLCIPESSEIFNASPVVNDVIVIDKKGNHKSLRSTLKLVTLIKKTNYIKLYSSHRSFRTAVMVLFLGIKESFGFDNSSLKHVYKTLVRYNLSKHEVERNLDLIGYNYDNQTWRIKPEIRSDGNVVVDKISEFLDDSKIKDGFIAIAPGSVWETKKYPLEYYKQVIKYFTDKNEKIVLIGGSKDKELCASLVQINQRNIHNASGIFSVVESIELLKHAKILISNDSAPTHMGMVSDIRVLTIYCSTVPNFGFYPYNTKSKSISFDDLDCKPCGIHGYEKCPIKTFDCGKKLESQKIISTIQEMLNDK